ncbi:979_t:CDS:2, partial [Acaulospora colombiana]
MPPPKSRKASGPGRAIIRDRFKESSRPKDRDTILHTTELNDGAGWTKLQSITQQRDLDEFLANAQLAGTQFTAEKLNIKVVTNSYHNPFLLSADKEKETLERHEANKERLVIPRRPNWDKFTTPMQLEINEKNSFLQWRRDLAHLQEHDEFLLTPFEHSNDPRVRINTADDLISLLAMEAGEIEESPDPDRKLMIGLVGYPNVGKSSTINALLGEKRVSVSSTPGKTKHFQTIHISPLLVLCDCPGLVFPNFATTNGDMVCNGVLPIDQLREYTGPVALITQRIPKYVLETIYGIKIKIKSMEEGGTGTPTAEELLVAYATARGFTKSGHGNLDESRAARYILKDYVNGKLLFCHPPPTGISKEEFNAETHDLKLYTKKKKLVSIVDDKIIKDTGDSLSVNAPSSGSKSEALDKSFFSNNKQFSGPKITGKFASSGEF